MTMFDAGIAAGAVKRPVALIAPAEADQITLACPLAVNCCVAPRLTFAVAGKTVTGDGPLTSVTLAVPARFPAPVAVIVTMFDAGITAGAVNKPVAVMAPAEADHVTLDWLAVNC